MKHRTRRYSTGLALVAYLWLACAASAFARDASCTVDDDQTRHVVDMAGRAITLPHEARRIATVGSVPVINGYLLALGAGASIVNGLPSRFTVSDRWRLHLAVAPHLAERPALQGQSNSGVNLEDLIQLAPDIVITMNMVEARALEKSKIPVLYLEWADTADIEANMRILACVTGRSPQGEAYLDYFKETMQRVSRTLDNSPGHDRPTALYFNPLSMSTPLQIANWWIAEAGGRSATAHLERAGNTQYSHERVLAWNPDIFIVNAPQQVEAIYQDERFSKVSAVRNHRVYATPMGTHIWGQRSVEQPLTVLWAAKIFHPQLFADVDIEAEIKHFYRRFFNYELTDDEIGAMLEGRSL